MKRTALKLLASGLITLALIEAGLRIIDPWGIIFEDDVRYFYNHVICKDETCLLYHFTPGEHKLPSGWEVHIQEDGTRKVPSTNQEASLNIAFAGDSVTFSQSVDDQDAWVNLLAQEFPEIHMINTGQMGYNIQQVALTIEATEADRIVYLIVSNDANPPLSPLSGPKKAPSPFYIARYWSIIDAKLKRGVTSQELYGTIETKAFDNALKAIANDDRVTFVAIEGNPLIDSINDLLGYEIEVIPRWTSGISWLDPHPNAAGSQQMAWYMAPIVRSILSDWNASLSQAP